MNVRKQMHDALLKNMPEGAAHDRETCELCTASNSGKPEGGQVDTFTAEEVEAAIRDAIAPYAARIAAMETAATESAVETRVAAVRAEAEAEVAEVRAQLDAAVLEAQAARAELQATVAYLEETAAAEAERAAIEARRDERLAKVREVANFPDEYIEANADRFSAMSDEDFEARVAEWAALAPKQAAPLGAPPKVTALVAARETNTGQSPLSLIREMKLGKIDPRDI